MGEVDTTVGIVPLGVVAGAARIIPPEPNPDGGEHLARSHGMDGIRELLSAAREANLVAGNLRALMHVAIGRKITRPDGAVVSSGVTWRELAAELKNQRFDTEGVREYGADPVALAARERERFWYAAISAAKVDSAEAIAEADRFAPKLKAIGFVVGPAPGTATAARPKAPAEPATPKEKEKAKDDKAPKKKKK